MKKNATMWKKILLALAILFATALLVWTYLTPAQPLQVQSIAPTKQTLETKLDLNATVINDQIVTITALLNGKIGQIKAREGDAVKSGEALALLDNRQAQSLLDKAVAELDYKRQKFKTTSRSYARLKNLSKAGNTSKQNVDDALDAFRSAETEVTIAQASVTLAELQLQNGTVRAPFAGTIIQQYAESGQWVEAGTPLFKLVAKDAYLIEAHVDASDWALVSMDQLVSLTTESAPDKQWQSVVSWIAASVATNDRDAKAVAIRFPLGKDAPPLLLGQEVDAELVLKQVEDALTLPLSAMVEREPGEYVVFVAQNNKAKLKPISVGLQNATHAEITDGLNENENVLVAPRAQLVDGMSIEIK